MDPIAIAVYALPLALIWFGYAHRKRAVHDRSAALLESARSDGMTEPPSMHPKIDPARCLGCAVCVDACPEHDVLGLIHGKAVLVQPANCIGHGACKDACPQGAIRLVLGTERRGVEVPVTGPDFQTRVPGIYVAGELGGMGLIRNAITQGVEAVDAIAQARPASSGAPGPDGDVLDLVTVGAGPAGIASSLRARELGMRSATLEQDDLGGTVAHYPRGKIVMTAPVDLPLYGRVDFSETTKESLLELWLKVIAQTGLEIHTGQAVTAIEPEAEGFVVSTSSQQLRTRSVLLCLGRRGTPRKLGVPGEEASKVVYRLAAPEQYRGQRVLVVGGGDSALEAAISISEEPGTEVSLAYRASAFTRAKAENRERLERAERSGAVVVHLDTSPTRIDAGSVTLDMPQGPKEIANDAVIVCAGGILPSAFLRKVGIEVEMRHGE